eukprot:CAMPEP_0168511120 /NCGR_PEP_ID=MMETSP0405-20121227/1917_1 /TAXON_ID=498012 /ORGANISM="Trichosphaerium sp, Strain Am-I-7 wt" /LENGTH=171 /DNA_ID=CAMNT_0008529179 /DNA_START=249 /DNA_END=764 /DNA_ORIENTATION=-
MAEAKKAAGGTNSMMNNPMMDPMNMNSMMKRNAAMLVSNLLVYTWIDHFFAGFVALKLPFGMTEGFRPMLQSGLGLRQLDVRYVSSMSWYVLNLVGLRGLISMFLGGNNKADEAQMMRMQMQSMQGGAAGMMGSDPSKAYKDARENLQLIEHTWALENTELRLIKKLKLSR